MRLLESIAELNHKHPHLGRLNVRDDLGGKVFALDRSDGETPSQLVIETIEPLLDHPLHPRRRLLPVKARSFHPLTCLVLHEITTLLQVPEQLDRKKGMAPVR